MRTALSTILVFVLLGLMVIAEKHTFHACTMDSYAVTWNADLNDQAVVGHPEIAANISIAFIATAEELSLYELQTSKGFNLFISKLTAEEQSALPSNLEIPAPTGEMCK